MAISTAEILDVMREHGVVPEELPPGLDLPRGDGPSLPGVGEVEEGETVYATSIDEVFGDHEDVGENAVAPDDPRIREWWEGVRPIVESTGRATAHRVARRLEGKSTEPPEPHCAWYSPIHFFGHGWGIYIRERCVLDVAADVAAFVDWSRVHLPSAAIAQQLLRSAFYAFFLHEQFHHKVESLGLRLLVSTDSDRYRPYKNMVYRPTFLTTACLEESLANAELLRRLDEPRYVQRIDPAIRTGLRKFLRAAIAVQPPGYREGLNFVREEEYRAGLNKLQSQVLDASLTPRTPDASWSVAPNMITALADISDSIYVVLPRGARPIFRPTWVDPGATVSTRELVGALTKHYGYEQVAGGKGSHVKLKKPGAPTITLAGNRPVLSPGLVKHALDALGGYPISRVPDLLAGKLPAHA
jgi:predicted RNA binding protein YcfA (HicA-like mRNA interferase family)